jgi:hypothetical protein
VCVRHESAFVDDERALAAPELVERVPVEHACDGDAVRGARTEFVYWIFQNIGLLYGTRKRNESLLKL